MTDRSGPQDLRQQCWLGAALVAAVLVGPVHAQTQAPTPGAVPVGVVPRKQPVARSAEFVGRIEAPGRVDVRARVTGYLDAVLFKEGDRVKEGDPLYRIDRAPFQAAVQQAQGALLRAQAKYTNATLQRNAPRNWSRPSAASVRRAGPGALRHSRPPGRGRDRRRESAHGQNQSRLHRHHGADRGRIGRTGVTKGNLVGPDTGVLTTIVSQDPMYVTFPVSQREFLNCRTDEGKPTTKASR